MAKPPPTSPRPPPAGQRPEPLTNRRAEVEAARRTAPVQGFRGQLKTADRDDEPVRRMAEALRALLRQK